MKNKFFYTAIIIISFLLYPLLNNEPNKVYILQSWLDYQIPFLPIFSIPYILYLPYITATLIFFVWWSRFLHSITISFLVCMLTASYFYIFFQTTVPRPDILSEDIFSKLVKLIYSLDKPYNCFPSLHATFTVLAHLYWKDYSSRNFPCLIIFTTSILLSTLLIKQHFIIDVIGGTFLAFLGYYLGMLASSSLKGK